MRKYRAWYAQAEGEIQDLRAHRTTLQKALLDAEARERALREALEGLLALIDEGWLVRNVTNDGHFPSFMAESTRLVTALQAAKTALAPRRG